MNNFGQMTPEMMSAILNPEGMGAGAGIGMTDPGLGVVPGMGQVEGMAGIPGGGAPAGGNPMAAMLGMQALGQMQKAGSNAPQRPLTPAPGVAPRGQQVQTKTEDQSDQIDPKLYMAMAALLGGGK